MAKRSESEATSVGAFTGDVETMLVSRAYNYADERQQTELEVLTVFFAGNPFGVEVSRLNQFGPSRKCKSHTNTVEACI